MIENIYKLTEVEFIQKEYSPREYDEKRQNLATISNTASTPSISPEQIINVRKQAELYF